MIASPTTDHGTIIAPRADRRYWALDHEQTFLLPPSLCQGSNVDAYLPLLIVIHKHRNSMQHVRIAERLYAVVVKRQESSAQRFQHLVMQQPTLGGSMGRKLLLP